MTSPGQRWARDQLAELAQASRGTFEVFDVVGPAGAGDELVLEVTISCSAFASREGGIRLKPRERIRLEVPATFPLSLPRAYFCHDRYAGNPHVQWGRYICLYQAPDVEWNASRGMLGFISRLHDWLRDSAAGALDAVGMPLHPPVAYPIGRLCIIPREDTPTPTPPFWSGYVEVTREDKVVAELGRWIEGTGTIPETRLATAILLPGSMPFEYPATMFDLVMALIARGMPLEILRLRIQIGVLRTRPGDRALFVLGAAMRGIAGGQRKQHLACWRIDADLTDKFRSAALAATEEDPVDEKTFYEWAARANVEWCRVLEDRPEIVERRDSQSPATWWRDKAVAIFGCGAIGSAAAMMLARGGVARLCLFDENIVTPGILVRQGYSRKHVGYTKASAMALAVREANPNVEVSAYTLDLVKKFADRDWTKAILTMDVIIDATASPSVAAAIEAHFRTHPQAHPPILAIVLGHRGDFGMMTLATDLGAGISLHLDRKAKLAFANSRRCRRFLQEFWPTDPARRLLFQPEPGCSSPTFRGSYVDVLGLVARMTNVGSKWLADERKDPRAFAMDLSDQAGRDGTAHEVDLALAPPLTIPEGRHGYEIRLAPEALRAALSWVRSAERVHQDRTETGGIIFGQIDEFLRIVWVDEVSGPPADSVASPQGFVCGTEGVAAMNEEKLARSHGSVAFVGMWHTHPQGLPIPSATDLQAMRGLLGEQGAYLGRSFLMVIVGGTSARPVLSAGLYERADYVGA